MLSDELVLTSEMEELLTKATSVRETGDRELDGITLRYMELALKRSFELAETAADRCVRELRAGNAVGERLSKELRERGVESFRQAILGAFQTVVQRAPNYQESEGPTPFFMRRLIEVIEHVRDFVWLYVDVRGLDDEFIPWLAQYSRAKTWSASLPPANSLVPVNKSVLARLRVPRYGVDPEFLFCPPNKIEPQTSFALVSTFEESGSWVATFEWPGGGYARYWLGLVPGQSVFEEPPIEGYVAFSPAAGILLAFQDDSNVPIQGFAHYDGHEFFGDKVTDEVSPPVDVDSWQLLANLIMRAMYDDRTQTWSEE